MSLFDLPALSLAVIAFGFVIGAVAKGALGAGLPALGLPIMVMVIEPAYAVSLFVVPVMLSNVWQVFDAGHYREAFKRFWPFLVMLVGGVWFGAGVLTRADPKVMALVLGCVVVATTLGQIFVREVRGLRGRSRFIHPVAGAVLGVCGGATGMFAPIIVYFAALRLEKDLFVTQLALVAMSGSLPLYARLVYDGQLHWDQLTASTVALVPAGVGLAIGFWVRKRMSELTFRKAVWAGLLVLGCVLIWRGLA
jgi:uncharacterized membrane protein YfcA